MLITVSVLSAILPSLVLLWYFYTQDLNRNPGRPVLITFVLGVLIVFPVAVLELTAFDDIPADSNPYLIGLVKGFWGAAIPEELLKFIVVVFYCSRLRDFTERMDGMVYGAVASLGFAAMENVLYVTSGGIGLAMSRAFTAVPCHAFLGAIMGYYVGQARFESRHRGQLLATGLAFAILLHGMYDFPLLTIQAMDLHGQTLSFWQTLQVSSLSGMTLATLLTQGVLAIHLQRHLRARQLRVHVRLRSTVSAKLFEGYV
jgi:RsiW-degrading membrane proteinase PrsW (M82 family)